MRNILGWVSTGLALFINMLSNVNIVITLIISITSLIFLLYKIIGQHLENKKLKAELAELIANSNRLADQYTQQKEEHQQELKLKEEEHKHQLLHHMKIEHKHQFPNTSTGGDHPNQ